MQKARCAAAATGSENIEARRDWRASAELFEALYIICTYSTMIPRVAAGVRKLQRKGPAPLTGLGSSMGMSRRAKSSVSAIRSGTSNAIWWSPPAPLLKRSSGPPFGDHEFDRRAAGGFSEDAQGVKGFDKAAVDFAEAEQRHQRLGRLFVGLHDADVMQRRVVEDHLASLSSLLRWGASQFVRELAAWAVRCP